MSLRTHYRFVLKFAVLTRLTPVDAQHPTAWSMQFPRCMLEDDRDIRLSNAALVPEALWLTDRYDFLAELGRGGMGIVYLARERARGHKVAIKLLGSSHALNAEAAARFAREARVVTTLEHPNIIRTLAIEELGGATAIVSEYIPGYTLRARLAESGAMSFNDTARILRDIAAALEHAHGYRIVHRDVKPENIFIEKNTGRALLSDFGIAKALDSDAQLTSAGSAIGTPSYMAPEQIRGKEFDERVDVYSLGLVGWEMLTGSRPWEGETLYHVLHKQQHDALPALIDIRPDIPAYLLFAIERAIAKGPNERWANASVFLQRLTPVVSSGPRETAAVNRTWTQAETVQLSRSVVSEEAQPVRRVEAIQPAPMVVEPEVVERAVIEREVVERAATMKTFAPAPHVATPRAKSESKVVRSFKRNWISIALFSTAAAVVALTFASGDDGRGDELAPVTPQPRIYDSASSTVATTDSDVQARRADTTRRAPTPRVVAPVPAVAAPVPPAAASQPPRASTRATSESRDSESRDSPPASNQTERTTVCSTPTAGAQRSCLLAEIDRYDAALTRTYQTLIARLRNEAGGVREPPAVQSLRAEQRAWITRRDRACRGTASSGQLWAMERAPCFARMSDERDQVLRARIAP